MGRDNQPKDRQLRRRTAKAAQRAGYAQQLFEQGDLLKGIRPRRFDAVYAVFDRDDHNSYFNALSLAQSLDGKLRNDEKQLVPFKAIVSIPSFELWLLLHYEDVQAPIHRDEALDRLKQHIPGYKKGLGGMFETTHDRLDTANCRAQALAAKFSAYSAPEPFTALHELVALLSTLRS